MYVVNLFLNLFRLFSLFPSIEAVQKLFVKKSTADEFYLALQSEFTNLAEPIVPEITDYIFGIDTKAIQNKIRTIKSYTLLVSVGKWDDNQNPLGNTSTMVEVSVSVVRPFSADASDGIDELLILNNCTEYLNRIVKYISFSCQTSVNFPVQYVPEDTTTMFGCIGITALLTLEAKW
jgi:hypothetical protein